MTNFHIGEQMRLGGLAGVGIAGYQGKLDLKSESNKTYRKVFDITNKAGSLPILGTVIAIARFAVSLITMIGSAVAMGIFAAVKQENNTQFFAYYLGLATTSLAFSLGEAIPGIGTLLHMSSGQKAVEILDDPGFNVIRG